ncbi:exosortase N [Spirosoma aerophilum]
MFTPDATTLLAVALLLYAGWPGEPGSGPWRSRLLGLLLLSPGLRYFSALFTFPIRLQLSSWAGSLLRLAGLDVQTEGNVLIRNGVEMAVDPACMGLQLTGLSLLIGLFFLIWQERQVKKVVPFGWVIAFAAVAFGLTIVCNLFRIILLVALGAMPNTWAHEWIGLVCVAAYAWLPIWTLSKRLVSSVGWALPKRTNTFTYYSWARYKAPVWGLGFFLVGVGVMIMASRPVEPPADPCRTIRNTPTGWSAYGAGCPCKPLANGLVQLSKPGVLIYLKPQYDWFSADHNPTACWRGSGYELRRVRETTLDGHPAYIGELRKKSRVLYTAWWFSNGETTTISQLIMRKQMLQNRSQFMLVNVTLSKENDFLRMIKP